LIVAGRPGAFISNPIVTKREWDAVSSLHPKTLALCHPEGLDKENRDAFAELLDHIKYAGSPGDPLYLRIQKFHRAKIANFVERRTSASGIASARNW
jgi:hypothetical protein